MVNCSTASDRATCGRTSPRHGKSVCCASCSVRCDIWGFAQVPLALLVSQAVTDSQYDNGYGALLKLVHSTSRCCNQTAWQSSDLSHTSPDIEPIMDVHTASILRLMVLLPLFRGLSHLVARCVWRWHPWRSRHRACGTGCCAVHMGQSRGRPARWGQGAC
jgi:hypothetical protein